MTKFKRALSLLLMVAMLSSSLGVNGLLRDGRSFASLMDTTTAMQNDYASHWAAESIQIALKNAVTSGYPDGSFKPDNEITRAEFFALINNTFGFTQTTDLTFTDVNENEWHALCISKAKAAGYATGYPDGSMKPNDSISRQEVAAILSHLRALKATCKSSSCIDLTKMTDWGKEGILSVLEAGIMNGYPDGKFKPMAFISRAEALIAVKNCIDYNPVPDLIYFQAGTYGDQQGMKTLKNNVTIKAGGTTLQNLIITGNLTIDPSVGNGEVCLKNVTVKGKVLVDAPLRMGIQGNTRIAKMYVYSNMTLDELGMSGIGVEGIEIDKALADNLVVTLKNTVIDYVSIRSNGVTLNADQSTSIKEIQSRAAGTQINAEAGTRIAILTTDKNLEMKGGGIVEKVRVPKSFVVKMPAYPTGSVMGGGIVVIPPVIVAAAVQNIPYVSPTPRSRESDPEEKRISKPVGNRTATVPGKIYSIYPKNVVVGDANTISIDYYAGEEYTNGSVVFNLPDAITADGDDLIAIASGSTRSTIKGLGSKAVISEQGHKVTISNIMFNRELDIHITLLNKIISSIGDFVFSIMGDKDGAGSAYTPTAGTGLESEKITAGIGKSIKGTISLPGGALAPEGGMSVEVEASSTNRSFNQQCTYMIPAGQNAINYSINVLPNEYRINYKTTNLDYVSVGYYGPKGTAYDLNSTQYVNVSHSDVNNINLELIKGETIKGTLSLPNGVISQYSTSVRVIALSSNLANYYEYVTIPAGKQSVEYSIRVPVGKYKVYYEIYNYEYIPTRYFSDQGMVTDAKNATMLTIDSPVNNINLTVGLKNAPNGTTTSGSAIALPMNAVAKAH